MREKVVAMAMTFDGQDQAAGVMWRRLASEEEVSSSLLGKCAPPF